MTMKSADREYAARVIEGIISDKQPKGCANSCIECSKDSKGCARDPGGFEWKYKGILEKVVKELVQPVKHGEWEETHISLVKYIPEGEKEEGHSFYMAEMKCSCCKRYNTVTFVLTLDKPGFCQLCGARMDGDTE